MNARRLQALFESMGDAIVVVNRGGIIILVNETAARVMGEEPEALLGSKLFSRIHAVDYPCAYAAYFNVIEGLEPSATTMFRLRWRDGKYRHMEVKVSKLRDSTPQSVVLTIRLGPLEGRLLPPAPAAAPAPPAPAADNHNRFLAMIAHELRTPLMPIPLGLGELADDERFTQAALPWP
jgi:PAS domain S-box-containing protein